MHLQGAGCPSDTNPLMATKDGLSVSVHQLTPHVSNEQLENQDFKSKLDRIVSVIFSYAREVVCSVQVLYIVDRGFTNCTIDGEAHARRSYRAKALL